MRKKKDVDLLCRYVKRNSLFTLGNESPDRTLLLKLLDPDDKHVLPCVHCDHCSLSFPLTGSGMGHWCYMYAHSEGSEFSQEATENMKRFQLTKSNLVERIPGVLNQFASLSIRPMGYDVVANLSTVKVATRPSPIEKKYVYHGRLSSGMDTNGCICFSRVRNPWFHLRRVALHWEWRWWCFAQFQKGLRSHQGNIANVRMVQPIKETISHWQDLQKD